MGGSPPDGWKYVALHVIAEVVSGGTPSRSIARYWGGTIPWATPTEVSGTGVRYLDSTRESITEAGVRAGGLRILPVDSVLVTTRATIGAVARSRVPMTTNQGFQNLVPLGDTDASWLFHAIEAARPVLQSLAAGSTFKEVSRKSFRNLRLLVAPPHEQRAIAAVLDAIDDAIALSERAVAATETLRLSVLHELLTRGTPGQHTEWTKVRELGQVPSCWDVRTLGDILVLDQPGTWGSDPDNECSQPVVRAADFTAHGRLDVARAPRRNVPLADRTRRLLADGDIVVERSGGGPGKPVGRVAIAQGLGRAYCSNFCQQLRVDESLCTSAFAALALEYRHRRGITLRMEQRTTGIRNLDYDAYRSFPLPLPSLKEQKLIVEVLEAADERRLRLAATVDSLRVVKATLSDALLQGRVRIPAGSR